jgi:hypothetical protein
MGLERSDADAHPLIQRQRLEQTVELRFAVGAVKAEDPALARSDGPLPEPDEVPLVHELGGGGCFGALAVLDLGRRSSVRNVDLELN